MEREQHTIYITGAAGYVGGMLADQLSRRDDVALVVALDKDPDPGLLSGNEKVVWLTANLADDNWQERVRAHSPDTVIHCAWQIRELYGKRALQRRWNVDGSKNVFAFAFGTPSVERLVYFSTASSYGAYPTNTLEHLFREEEGFRDEVYRYAAEKKEVEEYLEQLWHGAAGKKPQVAVVRPAAITGPRGRNMFTRFGLMATLRNKLPNTPLYRLVSLLVNRIPVASELWCRQFIHEDDVNDIVTTLALGKLARGYDVFNIAPPGPPVLARDMAEITHKKVLRVAPLSVRVAFFLFWHLTRGKVATSPGGWRFYCYPIVMDGSKITAEYGYAYRYHSRDALERDAGRYRGYAKRV